MALPAPTYDLVMLLDSDSDEAARAKLVADARAAIESEGQLLRDDDWGNRTLAYPIQHRSVADYHLLQFHATPKLLSSLERSLRIADGVLRFRIVKLEPGTGEAPDMQASASADRTPAASASEAAPAPAPASAPDAPAPAPDAAAPAAEPDGPPAGGPPAPDPDAAASDQQA